MPEWKQDSDGQWWYHYGNQRKRGEERTCGECGEAFLTHNKKAGYCSPNCRNIAAGKKRRGKPVVRTFEPKPCAVCGKDFEPASGAQRYCSDACKRGTSTCEQCGVEFVPSHNAQGRFCSTDCLYASGINRTVEDRECPTCGETFRPRQDDITYCSRACSDEGRRKDRGTCAHCDEPLTERGRTYCSRSCAIRDRTDNGKHPRNVPMGTRRPTADGYRLVKVGKDYPGAYKSGWMREHRYVVAETIGRPLTEDEHVHHINGDRADNRIENLELWTTSHPKGVRVSDLSKSG